MISSISLPTGIWSTVWHSKMSSPVPVPFLDSNSRSIWNVPGNIQYINTFDTKLKYSSVRIAVKYRYYTDLFSAYHYNGLVNVLLYVYCTLGSWSGTNGEWCDFSIAIVLNGTSFEKLTEVDWVKISSSEKWSHFITWIMYYAYQYFFLNNSNLSFITFQYVLTPERAWWILLSQQYHTRCCKQRPGLGFRFSAQVNCTKLHRNQQHQILQSEKKILL